MAFDNNGKDRGLSFEVAATTKNGKIIFWHGQPVAKELHRCKI